MLITEIRPVGWRWLNSCDSLKPVSSIWLHSVILCLYLDVSCPGPGDEPPPRAVQSHGRDLVFVVGVCEAKDLSSTVDVPHIHLPTLTPTHNLMVNY